MKKKRNILLTLTVWLIAVIAVACVLSVSLLSYAEKPVSTSGEPVTYTLHVPNGTTVMKVAEELESAGIIKSRYFLYGAARFQYFDKNNAFSLKSGMYELSSAMPLAEIYAILQTGTPENIKISIPEGLTLIKTAILLDKAGLCDRKEFVDLCKSQELLDEYKIASPSLEGYLFPDTYFFTEGMATVDIIRKLVDTFFLRIADIPQLKDAEPEELHRLVVLASIVEREYQDADEAPVIASVFQNRLDNKIGLYSCATIEYILTEIQGKPHPDRITYEDLKIDNPYNTYKWSCLPPGAISNPGLIALKAAVQPAETDYFYFVLTDAANGRHTFSKTFSQHIKAENLVTKPVEK